MPSAEMPARPLSDVAPGYVAIGRVLGAWGLRGEAKVEPLAPSAQFSRGLPVLVRGQQYIIERTRAAGRWLRVKFAGVDRREEAQALGGAYVEVREEDLRPLPEGHYYRYQLVGLAVRASDGRDLGHITDVMSTAESDVFVVRGPLGEVLVPATDEIVLEVDLERGLVTVEIVPGLLPGSG